MSGAKRTAADLAEKLARPFTTRPSELWFAIVTQLIADHDAALVQAVREQCEQFIEQMPRRFVRNGHPDAIGITRVYVNREEALAGIRALSPPDADRRDERIRPKAQREVLREILGIEPEREVFVIGAAKVKLTEIEAALGRRGKSSN